VIVVRNSVKIKIYYYKFNFNMSFISVGQCKHTADTATLVRIDLTPVKVSTMFN